MSAAAFAQAALIPACEDSQTEVPSSGGKYMGDFTAPKLDKVRIAFIGVGKRGGGHLKTNIGLEGTEVVAISDLYEDNVNKNKNHSNIQKILINILILKHIGAPILNGKPC